MLECATYAQAGPAVRWQGVDAKTTKAYLTSTRRQRAGDKSEQRRFASTIGADDGLHKPWGKLVGQRAHRMHAAEIFTDAFHCEQRSGKIHILAQRERHVSGTAAVH